MDLALNNLQRLICHKTQPTNQRLVSINYNNCDIIIFYDIDPWCQRRMLVRPIWLTIPANTNIFFFFIADSSRATVWDILIKTRQKLLSSENEAPKISKSLPLPKKEKILKVYFIITVHLLKKHYGKRTVSRYFSKFLGILSKWTVCFSSLFLRLNVDWVNLACYLE